MHLVLVMVAQQAPALVLQAADHDRLQVVVRAAASLAACQEWLVVSVVRAIELVGAVLSVAACPEQEAASAVRATELVWAVLSVAVHPERAVVAAAHAIGVASSSAGESKLRFQEVVNAGLMV